MGASSLSANGLEFIARWEGEVLRTYLDAGGKPTIGVGHLIRAGESFPDGITHEEALELLSQDARVAEGQVRTLVTVPLSQRQFDALVSFTFNCGGGALKSSELLRSLNDGNYLRAADQLLQWCHVSGQLNAGLLSRRRAERELFLRAEDTQPDSPAALRPSSNPPDAA